MNTAGHSSGGVCAQAPTGGFITTHWSAVLAAGKEGSAESAAALENLCRTYWYPLYAYVRRNGHSADDAPDLVQAFFGRFLENGYLRLADRNRGRFRTFLLTAMKHFLINEYRKEQCEKRGSAQSRLSLDDEVAESQFKAEAVTEQPPDALYDRGWAAILLKRAIARLRAEWEHSGKTDLFERLKIFVWGEKNALSYEAMGKELGMTEGAVKVAVHRLRQRYGEFIRAEISETVASPAEIDDELRHLITVIRKGWADIR